MAFQARGLGALEGTSLHEASVRMRTLDALDIDSTAEPSDDGTPNDSVNDIFSRMRNTIAKIENSYGGGDFVIVGGDATVLSVFAAAACGVDLREHSRFELRPGDFFDLDEVVRESKAGRFRAMQQSWPSAEDEAKAREILREMGPRIFSETEAGSWVLGPSMRR